MKITNSILTILAAGISAVSLTLVGFAATEIASIENVTSGASSDVLVRNASKNLESIAIGFRDSLDSQMQNQYEMVRTWARMPGIVDAARAARSRSVSELFEMWSRTNGRAYKEGVATGDGDPSNDISPAVSRYFSSLSSTLHYPELFATDARGYVFASSGITGDFDQGSDDYAFVEGQGLKTYKPEPGGEPWYRKTMEAKDGLYVGPVKWDASAKSWGIEIVARIADPISNEYLGQLKAVFNYGQFIYKFVDSGNQSLYEVKVIDPKGLVVATSLSNKDKVNNPKVSTANSEYFTAMQAGQLSGASTGVANDENGESIFAGYAVSKDANRHALVVTRKQATIATPINTFVSELKGRIEAAGQQLQRKMAVVALGSTLAIFLVAWALLRAKITVPIAKLTKVSERLAQGDIDGLKIDVAGKDEIGQFGESFKGVLAAFHQLMEEADKPQK